MRQVLAAAAAVVVLVGAADAGWAQSNRLGLLQQVQATQAPPVATAPAAPAAPAAGTKLPDLTFEQLVGDEVVRRDRTNMYAIGAGAIAGVVVFNVVAGYVAPTTMVAGGPLAATLVADSAIAASRIYAVTSAVVGGLVGNWVAQTVANR